MWVQHWRVIDTQSLITALHKLRPIILSTPTSPVTSLLASILLQCPLQSLALLRRKPQQTPTTHHCLPTLMIRHTPT